MSELNGVQRISNISRDYASIYEELVKSVPNITKLWNISSEADPGVVLLKLMSSLGDMLSYNLDKQIQEVYPDTVTQRKNAVQVFGLMGYKLRWYRSATCKVYLINTGDFQVTIPKYSTFVTRDEKYVYTNIEQIEVPSSAMSEVRIEATLYQGIPILPSKAENLLLANPNSSWHSIYNYNITEDNVLDNRIYVPDERIDETTVLLIDNTGDTWSQTESLSMITTSSKYYELKTDENERPYISLVSYWKNFRNVNKFKLFYLKTDGQSGEISNNMMSRVKSEVIANGVLGNQADILITNERSTIGYNPETADEARDEAAKYINTFETLITLDDFTKATKRLNGVANCIATDLTNDPYPSSLNPMLLYEVKLYVSRTAAYLDTDKSLYRAYIQESLKSTKVLPLAIRVAVDDGADDGVEPDATVYYDWMIRGKIYLTEPVSVDRSKEIIVTINDKLRETYDLSNIEYNSTLRYQDVIATIKNSSPFINIVDMDPIYYYTDLTSLENPLSPPNEYLISNPREEIAGKYVDVVLSLSNGNPAYNPATPNVAGADKYRLPAIDERYVIILPNYPVTPGSISVRLEGNEHVIIDDKNGELISSSSFLNTGTINYETGRLEIQLNGELTSNFSVSYGKNKVSLIRYFGFNPMYFMIDEESIKQ